MQTERFLTKAHTYNHLVFGDGQILIGDMISDTGSYSVTFTKVDTSYEIGTPVEITPTDEVYHDTTLEFKNVKSVKVLIGVLEQLIKDMEQ